MHLVLLLVCIVAGVEGCLLKKVCTKVKQCKDLIAENKECGVDWGQAMCTASEMLKQPTFSSAVVEASIEDGKAEIKATFAKKEDLGTFFKTFAKPKELLQTTMSLACAAPKEITLSVTIGGGLGYSFSNSIKEIAKSVSEGSVDQEYLDQVTARMAVLDAVSATASVQWKPGDADPGALFTISASLDASLLPSGQ
eukprot:gene6322-35437_t